MKSRCYVKSMAQVSCQESLSEVWMNNPLGFPELYARAQEPDVKGLISPMEARRMSKVLKRALCTSLIALRDSRIEMPEAIITATGMGCMENSEKFMTDMCRYGENCLKPSLFMQSTHNTIGSQIAISLKCHGYNNTYSQKEVSFESALLDAWIQMRGGVLKNVLVGSHDEVTPLMAKVMRHTHPEYSLISETSFAAVLDVDASGRKCEVEEIRLMSNAEASEITKLLDEDRDRNLMTGVNGLSENDKFYHELIKSLNYKPRVLRYKNIFGDNFSSSAMAFYSSVMILERGEIPGFMTVGESADLECTPQRITIVNNCGADVWSLIRLKR